MEILETTTILKEYLIMAKKYKGLCERLKILQSGGSITSNISYYGWSKRGKHKDLSDNVATQEAIAQRIPYFIDVRWRVSGLLWELREYGLTLNAIEYLDAVYVRNEKKKTGSDKKYIAMLTKAMNDSGIYLPWLKNIKEC